MAKSKKTNSKSNKKVTEKSKNKVIENQETDISKELLKLFRIFFIVIVVLSLFYLLTVFVVGKDDKDELKDTEIQYEEILAGSSFNMRNNEYVVVYYDFGDEDLVDITSSIYSYSYTGVYRLYTIDMGSGFNKAYASEEKSNKNPEKAEDLLINGPTLIRFSNGKVQEYIEGKEDVIAYLK